MHAVGGRENFTSRARHLQQLSACRLALLLLDARGPFSGCSMQKCTSLKPEQEGGRQATVCFALQCSHRCDVN